jgi:putative ABC transport system substrate-binding protein
VEEAKTIYIEYRWGEANDDLIRAGATELVRLAPEVILTYGAPAIVALKQATSTIPIVFAGSSDPVEAGLVASLAHPGGNITGFSHFDYAYGSKWLEYLKQMAPEINRLVVLERPADPSTAGYLKVIRPIAVSLGLDSIMAEIIRPDDIEPAIEAAVQRKSNTGLLVLPDLIFPGNGIRSSTQQRFIDCPPPIQIRFT